jgi:hypothetical protein
MLERLEITTEGGSVVMDDSEGSNGSTGIDRDSERFGCSGRDTGIDKGAVSRSERP